MNKEGFWSALGTYPNWQQTGVPTTATTSACTTPISLFPDAWSRFLGKAGRRNRFDGEARRLLDIIATGISPELLPFQSDGKTRNDRAVIGPYELRIYSCLLSAAYSARQKISFLYRPSTVPCAEELHRWLKIFASTLLRQPVQTLLHCRPTVQEVWLHQRFAARGIAHTE